MKLIYMFPTLEIMSKSNPDKVQDLVLSGRLRQTKDETVQYLLIEEN